MRIPRRTTVKALRWSAWIGIVVSMTAASPPSPAGRLEFNRDIRPILSNHCYQCHGPDPGSRKAGLRLDRRDAALDERPDGHRAIVPHDPEKSELIFRIEVEDDTLRMPPRKSGKRLTSAQVETLRQWIEQGARWEAHWSLVPPKRSPLPDVQHTDWPANPIDRFILARLEQEQLAPSPTADPFTLIRRLTIDLTGLPPTPEEADAFREAYSRQPRLALEQAVDRLLASPRFGEHMAVGWLDLVRYADTVGYHSDVERAVSPYRDFVICAFNSNLPFDRFTIEQLGGDLLPAATNRQRVAAVYNMLIRTTEEGGAQPKEYLARYAADRVRNVASVWMGATMGCAECHDHKYDPYTTKDFYALEAFFADIQEQGHGTPSPTLLFPDSDQAAELAMLDARLATWQALQAASGRNKEAAATATQEIATLTRQRQAVLASIRKTIETIIGPPRITRVLHRGDWMDETGPVVTPAVPEAMTGLTAPASGARANRLDLAHWLVSRDHPQTARVVVNRLWKRLFGTGLVDTLDDLGVQGEWPTHPELLDWLAVEFMDRGWDVKAMVRLMATSSTYSQSSEVPEALKRADPGNRFYARQSSVRVAAEVVRDAALSAAGLLDQRLGGDSVRPYQPAGYWRFLNFPVREYHPSTGVDQHRRGLYTHWQRTLLHPSLLAFDAPSREECAAKRPVSNTPQAALALLNDPTFVEAARALAERAWTEGGATDRARLVWIWRQVVTRSPEPDESAILAELLEKARASYRVDPNAAEALLSVGEHRGRVAVAPTELAAWTSIARAILNLDEAITRN